MSDLSIGQKSVCFVNNFKKTNKNYENVLGAGLMKAKAVVRLKFPSEKYLEIVFKALKPEVKKSVTARSSADLEKEGKFLILKVEAGDTVALRAALNAYLRWINSVAKVFEVLEKQ